MTSLPPGPLGLLGRKTTLLRILGVAFGLAVAIGGTIGVGILRVPGIVATEVGTSGMIMMV